MREALRQEEAEQAEAGAHAPPSAASFSFARACTPRAGQVTPRKKAKVLKLKAKAEKKQAKAETKKADKLKTKAKKVGATPWECGLRSQGCRGCCMARPLTAQPLVHVFSTLCRSQRRL